MTHRKIFHLIVLLIFIPSTVLAQSPELGYDKYQEDAQSRTIEGPSQTEKILDAPAYGVAPLKASVRKVGVWAEDIHLVDKARYIYDEITDLGIYPMKTKIGDRHGNPPGVEFAYGIYPARNLVASGSVMKPLAVQYLEDFDISDTTLGRMLEVNAWTMFGFNRYKDFGLQLTFNDFLAADNYLRTTMRYHDNPLEDYFDQGPNFSVGRGFAFGIQEASVSLAVGRYLARNWTAEVGGIFSTSDVMDGKDNKKGAINRVPALHGVGGANLAGLGVSLEHDTRDDPNDPKSGGFQRLKAGYYEGVSGDDYGYAKYQFDVAQYIPVGEYVPFLYWDSVLAFRIGGEMNDDINNDNIPFFDLARLGGGETLRGYQYNRFFDENSLFGNVEYRYNIWSLRQYKVDATAFFDAGWIFDEVSKIEFSKIKESYGLGLRFIFPGFTLSLEGAHSDEGTEWYLKANPIF